LIAGGEYSIRGSVWQWRDEAGALILLSTSGRARLYCALGCSAFLFWSFDLLSALVRLLPFSFFEVFAFFSVLEGSGCGLPKAVAPPNVRLRLSIVLANLFKMISPLRQEHVSLAQINTSRYPSHP
jgi:hypothetical protein